MQSTEITEIEEMYQNIEEEIQNKKLFNDELVKEIGCIKSDIVAVFKILENK